MTREGLTIERLYRMGADDAAALLLVHGNADGYAGEDEALFDEWLAADPEHAEAFNRACLACARFDVAADDVTLSEMRARARSGPQQRPQWNIALAGFGAGVLVNAIVRRLRLRR